MSYQHRRIYAVFCVLLIFIMAYYSDLQELISNDEKISSAITREKIAVKQILVIQSDKSVEHSGIKVLSRLLHDFHLELISAVMEEDMAMHIIIESDYASIYGFLKTLVKSGSDISDLVMNAESVPHIKTEMRVKLNEAIHREAVPLAEIKNPFCGAQQIISNQFTFPVNTMRLLGAAEINHRRRAVMIFPDGQIYEAGVNEMIGKERGKIQKISGQQVTVLMPDQSQYVLQS